MKMVWPACLKRSTAPKRQDQCRFLRECATELETGLTRIFQTSLSSGCLSQDWTNANITPVFKKGDKHIAENYRPVSFTSVTCKRLEQIIYKQKPLWTERNPHKFKPWFQTWILVWNSVNHHPLRSVSELWLWETNRCSYAGLFQSVWHSAPQQTLTQTKQLWHHRQSPSVAPKLSDSATHEGSPWRRRTTRSTCRFRCPTGQPVPFLCRINDLPKAVKSQVRLFADHCLLSRKVNSQQDHQILPSDLNKLERWADIWGMHFNTKIFFIFSVPTTSPHTATIWTATSYNRLTAVPTWELH